jgi:hypothetical protein
MWVFVHPHYTLSWVWDPCPHPGIRVAHRPISDLIAPYWFWFLDFSSLCICSYVFRSAQRPTSCHVFLSISDHQSLKLRSSYIRTNWVPKGRTSRAIFSLWNLVNSGGMCLFCPEYLMRIGYALDHERLTDFSISDLDRASSLRCLLSKPIMSQELELTLRSLLLSSNSSYRSFLHTQAY